MNNLRKIGENVSSVAGQGVEGYNTGRSHGQTAAGLLGQFDSHMNRANMDALAGRPHPHDIFVRKYATNKHAAQLADYYRRTTPAMGGPRTAAWYTHYYGVSVPGASGTEGQMALLRHVRRQHEHIQAIRESPEPRGAFHNADSTAADVRPGIHQALVPHERPAEDVPGLRLGSWGAAEDHPCPPCRAHARRRGRHRFGKHSWGAAPCECDSSGKHHAHGGARPSGSAQAHQTRTTPSDGRRTTPSKCAGCH